MDVTIVESNRITCEIVEDGKSVTILPYSLDPTTHSKALHDALGIDAATLGGHAAAYFSLAGHSHAHSTLSGIGANDHHNQSHVLNGGDHTVSGLTPGHFLKALTETTFGFAAHGLSYSDVGAAASGHNHSHNALTDLTVGDYHTQYALLAGRAGGQTILGGTGSGDNLWLKSSSHNTKGLIKFGGLATSYYDEANDQWVLGGSVGIGKTPTQKFEVAYGNFALTPVPSPTTAPDVALAGAAGNINNGDHRYVVTYVTAIGETDSGPYSNTITVTNKTINGQVDLTNIPVAPPGQGVIYRKIYRTKIEDPNKAYYLTTLNDNTTNKYTDNSADNSLGADEGYYRENTTAWIYSGVQKVGLVGKTNVALGWGALEANMGGATMVAIGLNALHSNLNGTDCVAVGAGALRNNISGNDNTACGYASLICNIDGSDNVGLGAASLFQNLHGSQNLAMGGSSLYSLISGSNNVALRMGAGQNLLIGNFDIFLGWGAGGYETGSYKLFIDSMYTRIDEQDGRAKALIYGIMDADPANQSLNINAILDVKNVSSLGSESLNEKDFVTHGNWDTTGSCNDTGGNAVFTGVGTLTQTSGHMAIAGKGSRWYKFTYTVSGKSGSPAATITAAFAATAQTLLVAANGVGKVLYFKSAVTPGDFVISATAGNFTLDDVSLKEVQGGDVYLGGDLYFGNHLSAIGAAVGTLANAPTAGDPVDWIKIKVGSSYRAFPVWAIP